MAKIAEFEPTMDIFSCFKSSMRGTSVEYENYVNGAGKNNMEHIRNWYEKNNDHIALENNLDALVKFVHKKGKQQSVNGAFHYETKVSNILLNYNLFQGKEKLWHLLLDAMSNPIQSKESVEVTLEMENNRLVGIRELIVHRLGGRYKHNYGDGKSAAESITKHQLGQFIKPLGLKVE